LEFAFGPKVCEPAPQTIGQSTLLQHEARHANNLQQQEAGVGSKQSISGMGLRCFWFGFGWHMKQASARVWGMHKWKQTMEGAFDVMTSRFHELELTGKQVKTSAPAGEEEMASFHALLTKIDPKYTAKCTTKKDLKSVPNLVSWMQRHCRCTTYVIHVHHP
jgi:hypothetical protein